MQGSSRSRILAVTVLFVFCLALAVPTMAASDKVNINEASQQELQDLTYIGEVKAQRIVDYRQENEFDSKKEITEVEGVGEATFEENKDRIVVE